MIVETGRNRLFAGYGFRMSLRWRVRCGVRHRARAPPILAIVAIFAGLRTTHAADREVTEPLDAGRIGVRQTARALGRSGDR